MQLNRFAKYALFVLGYNLLVIVWGAYVRASKSGDGCGSHWPLCNGQVVPQSPTVATLVEFTHRITSGLVLVLVLWLLRQAFRTYPSGHPVRRASVATLVLTITEALIGAGLVLFRLVADNDSMARALWMSGHLVNTFLLLGALTLTFWFAVADESQPADAALTRQPQHSTAPRWWFALAIFSVLLVGVSGAVTALGATLFPVNSLAEGLRQDLSPTSHILIRLRFYHPLLAGLSSALLLGLAVYLRTRQPEIWVKRFSVALVALVVTQLLAGIVNLLLHAPIWLQLIHLLLSDLIWIALILLAQRSLTQPFSAGDLPKFAPAVAR